MSNGNQHYITPEGLEKLKQELNHLKTVARRELAEKINQAKELGDLSENAEYHDAKEQLGFTEGRIQLIEDIVNNATIIDEKKNTSDAVIIGSTVIAARDGKEFTYQIVGSNEADPSGGRISNESPLGRAFLGHHVGDDVSFSAPGGTAVYTIIRIA